jgi:hypothetical protein
MAYSPTRPDTPLATVKTALAAHCNVDALCLNCDRVRRLDFVALAGAGRLNTPLIRLPLRCKCGSAKCRLVATETWRHSTMEVRPAREPYLPRRSLTRL